MRWIPCTDKEKEVVHYEKGMRHHGRRQRIEQIKKAAK